MIGHPIKFFHKLPTIINQTDIAILTTRDTASESGNSGLENYKKIAGVNTSSENDTSHDVNADSSLPPKKRDSDRPHRTPSKARIASQKKIDANRMALSPILGVRTRSAAKQKIQEWTPSDEEPLSKQSKTSKDDTPTKPGKLKVKMFGIHKFRQQRNYTYASCVAEYNNHYRTFTELCLKSAANPLPLRPLCNIISMTTWRKKKGAQPATKPSDGLLNKENITGHIVN